MNKSSNEQTDHRRHCKKGRVARLGLFAVIVVGLGAIASAFVGPAWAVGSWKHHRAEINTVEQAREHAKDIAAWITGTVDATDQQGERIDSIPATRFHQERPLS